MIKLSMVYYVDKNAQQDGEHTVHEAGCKSLPDMKNRIFIGELRNCWEALTSARKLYFAANGCKKCMPECHVDLD